MNKSTRFKLPGSIERSQVDAILAERYAFLLEAPQAHSWVIYDTFDWRLFSQSLSLQWSGDELILRTLNGSEILHDVSLPTGPRFSRDLPDGILKRRLDTIINQRALLELATIHTCSWTYRILNKDEKTVVRLVYEEARPTDSIETPILASILTLQPLRGYTNQARQLGAYLQESLGISPQSEDFYFNILAAAGHVPGGNTGKLDVRLAPDTEAGEATKIILRHLLETMRLNEAGIKADIDIEFLHDYRIAMRRTRSALSLIRKVFPSQKTEYFKQEFRVLGKLTNDLRDLDIYLLAETGYKSMLPDAMQDDIAPLFDYLRSNRAAALGAVVRGLESEAYSRTMAEWEKFLDEPITGDDAANATVPINTLARKVIYCQYQSIVKHGTYILEHTEDELLHALRIECKKLRYLLEFFTSLFPTKGVNRFINQLKLLQDNLGEFSDLAVQQEYLLSIAEALDIDESRTRRALVATGFLVETMARKQLAVKAEFAGIFTKFASPAHQKQFAELFGSVEKVKS